VLPVTNGRDDKVLDANSFIEVVQSLDSDCAIHMYLCNGERPKASWDKAIRIWNLDKNFIADCIDFEIATAVLSRYITVKKLLMSFRNKVVVM
jgi:hypothetical protein